MNSNLTIVRDVSGKDKNIYYIIKKDEKQIYKIKDKKELKIIELIGEDLRWFEEDKLVNMLKNGYKMIFEI